jgi:transcriptional regulator with XRE-family HTH domain
MDGIMEFANQVKHVRSLFGLTQAELAKALHVSFATVNRWENSQARPSSLAIRSFYEFCENNFIELEVIDKQELGKAMQDGES